MEPELRKTEGEGQSAIETYQQKKQIKQNIFQNNINAQMQRMNERLKNRRSKSLLGKNKVNRDKSFDVLMEERHRRRIKTRAEEVDEVGSILGFLNNEARHGKGEQLVFWIEYYMPKHFFLNFARYLLQLNIYDCKNLLFCVG